MKKHYRSFLAGLAIGAIVFGGGSIYAGALTANQSTATVYLNGEKMAVQGYNVADQNYFRLADLAKEMNFDLSWREVDNSVFIDTTKSYSGVHELNQNSVMQKQNGTQVPQNDTSYRPAVGTVIVADSGQRYTITKQKPEEKALPEPICDWSQFPEISLPPAEARYFSDDTGEHLFIRNLYETRRMQYTLYNLVSQNKKLWSNGKLTTYKVWGTDETLPNFTIDLGERMTDRAQVFWPFRESELKKVFDYAPLGTWSVSAWDQYIDGAYHTTQYYVEHL